MLRISILVILIRISTLTNGQSNFITFETLFKTNDTLKLKTLLADWEKNNPDDPELYTCSFNYYFLKSKQEFVSIEKEQHGEESFAVTDSSGNLVGFMNSGLSYNSKMLKKAFDYIDKGIIKFPDRLDMRFGKCFVLGEIGDYTNFTKEIINTLEYSKINKNNWLWTENQKKEEAEKFMLAKIFSYQSQLYNTEVDSLLPSVILIGEKTLSIYPNVIEILSATSVALMLTKNFDKALTYLLEAEKQNPKDYIVINNIAQAYFLKGDKENAIKYYRIVEQYGDEQGQYLAKKYLEELTK